MKKNSVDVLVCFHPELLVNDINDFIKDGDLMYNYADELTKVNQLDSAIIVLNETMKYRYDDKCALLMGNLLLEKKQFSEAEKQFIQVVYLDPKLFGNSKYCFSFITKQNSGTKHYIGEIQY